MRYTLITLLFTLNLSWAQALKFPGFIKINKDSNGKILSSSADINLDGKDDVEDEYIKGKLIKRVFDINNDGIPEKTIKYQAGKTTKISKKFKRVLEETDKGLKVIVYTRNKKGDWRKLSEYIEPTISNYQSNDVSDSNSCDVEVGNELQIEDFRGFNKLYSLLKAKSSLEIDNPFIYSAECKEFLGDEKTFNKMVVEQVQKRVDCLLNKVNTPQARLHVYKIATTLEKSKIKVICNNELIPESLRGGEWRAQAIKKSKYDIAPAIAFNSDIEEETSKSEGSDSVFTHEIMHMIDMDYSHYKFYIPDYTVACSECCNPKSEDAYTQGVLEEKYESKNEVMCKTCGLSEEQFSEEEKVKFFSHLSNEYLYNFFSSFLKNSPEHAFKIIKFFKDNHIDTGREEAKGLMGISNPFKEERLLLKLSKLEPDVLLKYREEVKELLLIGNADQINSLISKDIEGELAGIATLRTIYTQLREETLNQFNEQNPEITHAHFSLFNGKGNEDFNDKLLVYLKTSNERSISTGQIVRYINRNKEHLSETFKIKLQNSLDNDIPISANRDTIVELSHLMGLKGSKYQDVYKESLMSLSTDYYASWKMKNIFCAYYANSTKEHFDKTVVEFLEKHKGADGYSKSLWNAMVYMTQNALAPELVQNFIDNHESDYTYPEAEVGYEKIQPKKLIKNDEGKVIVVGSSESAETELNCSL